MACTDPCTTDTKISVTLSPASGTSLGNWSFSPSCCVNVPYGSSSLDITYTLTGSTWSFAAVTIQLLSGPNITEPSSGVTITAPFRGTRTIAGGSYQVSQIGSQGGDGSPQKLTIEFTNDNDQTSAYTYGVFLTVSASGQPDQTSLDPQVVLEIQDGDINR